jgi:hypothetical protein
MAWLRHPSDSCLVMNSLRVQGLSVPLTVYGGLVVVLAARGCVATTWVTSCGVFCCYGMKAELAAAAAGLLHICTYLQQHAACCACVWPCMACMLGGRTRTGLCMGAAQWAAIPTLRTSGVGHSRNLTEPGCLAIDAVIYYYIYLHKQTRCVHTHGMPTCHCISRCRQRSVCKDVL